MSKIYHLMSMSKVEAQAPKNPFFCPATASSKMLELAV